jgi:hypothetical protein
MTISRVQAAAALDEIDRTELRTRVSSSYANASPYLILWGVVWIAGYGGCAVVAPEHWGLVWLPLVLIGSLGSAWLQSRAAGQQRRHGLSGAGGSWRTAVLSLAVMAFIGSVYYVFRPVGTGPYLVFPALIVGLIYSVVGTIARMPRFVWIGAAIFVATMAGYILVPAWTAVWIAVVAGGGLVLGGLWMRKI